MTDFSKPLATLPRILSGQQYIDSSIPGSGDAIGGGRDGRPRQSRIFRIASGGWIAASILMRALQRGHSKTSIENILFIN
jgi:hypothetical protein